MGVLQLRGPETGYHHSEFCAVRQNFAWFRVVLRGFVVVRAPATFGLLRTTGNLLNCLKRACLWRLGVIIRAEIPKQHP